MPGRRQSPVIVPRASYYNASAHDYSIDDSINRAEYFSNAVLEDTYDAAARSRGRDYVLLRNANAAIRSSSRSPSRSGESRTGRSSKRIRSVMPVEARSPSPTMALTSYKHSNRRQESLRDTLPTPSSLLSTKINSYLKGSSAPLSAASKIDYKSKLVDTSPPRVSLAKDMNDTISYRSYLSDDAVMNPLSTRSSSRVYHGYYPTTKVHQFAPYPHERGSPLSDHYGEDEECDEDVDDYEPSYRRKYKILRGPAAIAYKNQEDEEEEQDDSYDYNSRYGRATSVPVSSYRSRLDGGQSHTVDVYPLVETSVPVDRKLHLLGGADADSKLTMLEKINIKASIIGSRVDTREGGPKSVKPPKSQFAATKLRELKIQDIEDGIYYRPVFYDTGALHASRPPLLRKKTKYGVSDREINWVIMQHQLQRLGPQTVQRLKSSLVYDVNDAYDAYDFSRTQKPRPRFRSLEPPCYRPVSIYVPPISSSSHRMPQIPPVNIPDPTMEKEKQLLDEAAAAERAAAGGSSVKIPAYYYAGGDPNNMPVSELRRKLRRTIAKTKGNPNYYREREAQSLED